MNLSEKLTAIDENRLEIYNKGFTEGQESVDRIYKTSGSFVKDSSNYYGVSFYHGLPKTPKLVMCFTADYDTKIETNLDCGFVYTEKVFTSYRHQNANRPSVRERTSGVPNKPDTYSQTYYVPSVDDDKVYFSGGSGKWGGEFFWEAYTW